MLIWVVVVLGVLLGLMFITTSYSGEGGGCGGCLLILVVLILGAAIASGTN